MMGMNAVATSSNVYALILLFLTVICFYKMLDRYVDLRELSELPEFLYYTCKVMTLLFHILHAVKVQ